MTKRFSSKVLAVILTLAICATTVLGCLMTVSAAESCYSFGAPKFPSKDDLSQVSIDVTFTAPASLPNGISAGRFEVKEVNADAADYLTLEEVNVVTSGVSAGIEGGKVVFDGERNSTVTLTLVFGFSKKEATRGRDYNVTLNNVELACNDDEYYKETADGPVAKITTACQHVVTVVGEPIAVDKANDYSVYAGSVCTLCGEEFGIQLVPTAEKLVTDADNDKLNVVYIETSGAANINAPDGSFMDGTHGTGTEADPYVISNLSQLRYLAQKSTYAQTHGKFFEIDESIDIMVLQRKEYIGDLNAFLALDAEGVGAYLANEKQNGSDRVIWQSGATSSTDCFAGTLNGNGVRIVGAYNTNGGIIAYVNDGATAKNLTVDHCMFETGWFAGSIFGYSYQSTTYTNTGLSNTNCPGVITLDKVTVHDNYTKVKGGGAKDSTGMLFGHCATYIGVSVNNCIVYDCKALVETAKDSGEFINHPYAFGVLSSGHNGDPTYPNGSYKNSIFIGCAPYAYKASNQAFKYAYYTNVYTDQPNATDYVASSWYQWSQYDITVVSTANLKGSKAAVNATKLDWGKTWLVGENGQYPYLAPADYTTDTIYWNGDVTAINSTAAGTKDDPIIISTAAELAWLVSQKYSADVDGKYFKVADGIKNIVLQPYAYGADIMALDSAAATKAYFENGSSFLKWKTTGWDSASFTGYFDGNGVNIYGMYAVSTNNAALFCEVDGGSAITNLAVKNSYVTSSADNYQVGALIALSSNSGYGAKRNGMIWVKNVEISNNYLYNGCLSKETSRSGVLAGAIADAIQVENVLVYGNDATYGRGDEIYNMPLIAGLQNGIVAGENHYDGLVPKTVVDNGKTLYYNQVKNSIILGANVANVRDARGYRKNDGGCFTNVYTDGVTGEVTFTDGKFTYTEAQVKSIALADAIGPEAANNLSSLAWGSEWFCGADGNMPILAPFASAADTAGISNVSSADLQLAGSSVNYNNDGTLNFNLHFVPKNSSVKAVLYVGTSDATKFYKIEGTKSSYSDELGENAVMFSIPNLSARDIDKTWLSTVVTTGSYVQWGLTQPTALLDNAKAILAGNYDSADKQVAAALINYNMSSEAALNITTDTSVKKTKIVYAPNNAYDGSFMTGENAPAGTEDDPYIISTYGHWRYMAEQATYEQTFGKFFKVDPTIKMFVFQSESFIKKVGGLDAFLALDAQGVADVFENVELSKNIMRHNNGGNFAGTLDGSGVQIVGMSGVYYNSSGVMQKGTGGLFSKILEDATVKNLTISHTYNNTGDLNGVLIGYVAKQNAASDNVREINIENVILHDNYQVTTANGLARSGLLIGRVDPAYITIRLNGILTYDNKALGQRSKDATVEGYTDMLDCALIGSLSTGWNGKNQNTVNSDFKNIITIGNAPYPVSGQNNQGTKPEYWTNVYTDTVASFTPCTQTNYPGTYKANEWSSYDITILTSEQVSNLKGANAVTICSKLDWEEGWVVTNGYPQPIQSGYTSPASGKTIYWDGTVATDFESGTGTKEDPFVIATAAQFAYFVKDYTKQKNDSFTAGSYYKIADGIDKIVLQDAAYANDIIALDDAAEVKAYFEANASKMHAWVNEGWEQGSFYGNFDGNGVEVYGLYSNTHYNAGLFNTLDAGAVIKNISVINSYIKSYRTQKTDGSYESYQAAAIAPVISNSGSYGAAKTGIVWIDNCKVFNNYITHDTEDKTRCGVVVGSANSETVYVTNCLTYGNDATYNNGVKMPLIGDFTNTLKFENATAPEGLTLVARSDNAAYVANGVHNTIALGCTLYNEEYFTSTSGGRNTSEVYKNVYTDTETKNTYVTMISADILKGDAAANIVNEFNEANGKTVWYVGADGDMPGHKKAGNVPTKYQTNIDAITFDTYDVVGNGTEYYESGSMKFGVYQTALSLKANPYMSFAFAFGGEYKENRDKIKIRFTYTVDGVLTTSEEIAVPAYTGADIKNVNGWTNTTANGRFHTYKAECIPVKALANGIKVEASYNGGAWADLGTYSVEGLGMQFETLSKTQPSEYYTTRVDATKALLFYAQAIAARYGA